MSRNWYFVEFYPKALSQSFYCTQNLQKYAAPFCEVGYDDIKQTVLMNMLLKFNWIILHSKKNINSVGAQNPTNSMHNDQVAGDSIKSVFLNMSHYNVRG